MRHLFFYSFRVSACVSSVCLLATSPASFGQFGLGNSNPSFGTLSHKSVELTRKLPPVYDLHGKSVAVIMAPDSGAGRTNVEIQGDIEKLLTGTDSTVRVESQSPDLAIYCQISAYSEPKIESRSDGKVTSSTMVGGLNVAFKISETRSGHLIASSVASTQVIHDLGSGGTGVSIFKGLPGRSEKGPSNVTSTFDAQNAMVNDIARQIASYLVTTPEAKTIPLAVGGALNGADRLATTLLWSRNLEELTTMTPWTDPRLDAYRIYNIAVANEALAYAAQDRKAAIKYLQDASIAYGKATDARPDEKGFLPAQIRISDALEHYIHKDSTATAAANGVLPGPTQPVGGGGAPMSATEAMTDDDVIDMVRAKVDEAAVVESIQGASNVRFDLTPKGLIRLANGGIRGGRILEAMMLKAKTTAAVK